MINISINPLMAQLPAKEEKKWITSMQKDFPNEDWEKLLNDLKQEVNPNVKGTGGKSKVD